MFSILLHVFKTIKLQSPRPISEIQKEVQVRFNSGNINAQRGKVTDYKTLQERKSNILAFQFK